MPDPKDFPLSVFCLILDDVPQKPKRVGKYKGCVVSGYKQGKNAEREIRQMQASKDFAIKKLPFKRLVNDVVKDVVWYKNAERQPGEAPHEVPKVSAEALAVLQVAAESVCVELLRGYDQFASHANRKTITPRDMIATRQFTGGVTQHLLHVLSEDDRHRFAQVCGLASRKCTRGDWVCTTPACLAYPVGTRGRVSKILENGNVQIILEESQKMVALEDWQVEATKRAKISFQPPNCFFLSGGGGW